MSRIRLPTPTTPQQLARLCAAAAAAKKATDLLLLEVGPLVGYTDYFLLASARSTRQATAVAEHIESVLKAAGVRPLGTEGISHGRWALLDFGEVVVHIFHSPVRELYDLESLWAEAPRHHLSPTELGGLLPPELGGGEWEEDEPGEEDEGSLP